ncbi:MAG: helix-turn-helix domain-containing protein [Treponema sp.]|jgi:transcriptional regulator with XRE-family HTH domain|nr:helix-turn-helix domain-containing protein [Treponema sp.]
MDRYITNEQIEELIKRYESEKANGLKQKELAKFLGFSSAQINRIVRGKTKRITQETYDKIITYFNMRKGKIKEIRKTGKIKLPTGLAKTYYCLFPKTCKTDRDKLKYNTGTLKINKENYTVDFKMPVLHEKYRYKKYKGIIEYQDGYDYSNIYIALSGIPYPNENVVINRDVSYIQFKYYGTADRKYDFAIALILTPNAGEKKRDPTVQRMALSTKPFKNKRTNEKILPLLKLSGDEFYIKEKDLLAIRKQYGEDFRKELGNKKISVYAFDMSEINNIQKNKNPKIKAAIISLLRDKSLNSLQFDQISWKTQNNIRDIVNDIRGSSRIIKKGTRKKRNTVFHNARTK